MHPRTLLVPALALAAGLAAALPRTQEGYGPPPPAAEHRVLARFAGEWDARLTVNYPGMPAPMRSTGTHVFRSLGGRWVVGDFEANIAGLPYAGHQVDGYDPERGVYTSWWFDTMSNGPMRSEGTWDPETRTARFEVVEGELPPGTRQLDTLTWTDDDHFSLRTVWIDAEGAEREVMRSEYARRGSASGD